MKTEILESKTAHTPKPKWLRVKLPTGKKYTELRGLVDKYNLHTICTSGSCPNMGECWGEGTATFMILNSKLTTKPSKLKNTCTVTPIAGVRTNPFCITLWILGLSKSPILGTACTP